jgi:hypothetical protein
VGSNRGVRGDDIFVVLILPLPYSKTKLEPKRPPPRQVSLITSADSNVGVLPRRPRTRTRAMTSTSTSTLTTGSTFESSLCGLPWLRGCVAERGIVVDLGNIAWTEEVAMLLRVCVCVCVY